MSPKYYYTLYLRILKTRPVLKFHKIAASLLSLVMLFCVTKNSLLFALYELDTGTFVSLFCENKTRPQLKCNGHCKLAQMAKEQDKKDASQALNNLQQEIFLYYQEPPVLLPDISYCEENSRGFANAPVKKYTCAFLSRNDKPPEFLS